MSKELYKRLRPKSLNSVIGQDHIVDTLQRYFKRGELPHTILISGPTGTGKTTLARIIAKKLECNLNSDLDEINSAKQRGIDTAREISSRMGLAPSQGKARVWIIDEVHQTTSAAQESYLKAWEDTPDHVWFILCTTEPQKLIAAVKNRCLCLETKLLSPDDMEKLIKRTCRRVKKLSIESDEVMEKLVNASEGSPRKCLVTLDVMIGVEGEDEQLELIAESSGEYQAIEIARCLLNPRSKWSDMKPILESADQDPESIRYMILAYFAKVLLGGGKLAPRAALIIEAFEDSVVETKFAGLVLGCWRVLNSEK